MEISAPLKGPAGYAKIYRFRAARSVSACACSFSSKSATCAFFLFITACPDCFFNSSQTSCSNASFGTYPCNFSSSCCLRLSFSPESSPMRLPKRASSPCVCSSSSWTIFTCFCKDCSFSSSSLYAPSRSERMVSSSSIFFLFTLASSSPARDSFT